MKEKLQFLYESISILRFWFFLIIWNFLPLFTFYFIAFYFNFFHDSCASSPFILVILYFPFFMKELKSMNLPLSKILAEAHQ